MHIVTKFLVVFTAILSILLAGLSVAYTSNAPKIVQERDDAKARAKTFEAMNADLASRHSAEKEALQNKVRSLESTIEQLTSEASDLQGDNARLVAEVNDQRQAASLHAAQIDQFTAVAETYAQVNQAQSDELRKLRDKELDYARKEIELTDRINDLSGQLEVALETNRSLQEQIVELRDQLDRGGSTGDTAVASAGHLKPPSNFKSSVTAVREDDGGNVLVQIGAGLNDRLREDMKLMIVRDGWLANLILVRVDENESVGRVDFVGRDSVQIEVGDLVLSTAM